MTNHEDYKRYMKYLTDYLIGKLSFNDLSNDVKQSLIKDRLVDENGDLTNEAKKLLNSPGLRITRVRP